MPPTDLRRIKLQDIYWEHFEHGADIGVRGVGPSLSIAFEQTALAMMAVITDLKNIASTHDITIDCSSTDREILLVDWLNSLIYEMATRHMLFGRFKVNIINDKLTAIASGEYIDIKKHHPAVEIKGATLTELKVAANENGSWLAQCVVDV
jgi:SHS2 domain-containing protein